MDIPDIVDESRKFEPIVGRGPAYPTVRKRIGRKELDRVVLHIGISLADMAEIRLNPCCSSEQIPFITGKTVRRKVRCQAHFAISDRDSVRNVLDLGIEQAGAEKIGQASCRERVGTYV